MGDTTDLIVEFQRPTDNTTITGQCSYVNSASSLEVLLHFIVLYLSSRSIYNSGWYATYCSKQVPIPHSHLCGFAAIVQRFPASERKRWISEGGESNFSHISGVRGRKGC